MDYRRLVPIFTTVFTNLLGAGVILPILPLYAEGEFQATAFLATLLGAVYFGAQFIAAPWLGRLSDRVGRRPVLIISQLGTVFSFILFIYAGPLGQMINDTGVNLGITGGLFMLFVARTLDGLTGGNITTARAYVTDISSEENRAQALGIISAAFGLGFVFGPALGGALVDVALTAPFVAAAVLSFGSVLLTYFLLDESLPPEKRDVPSQAVETHVVLAQLQNRTVLLIMILMLSLTLAFSAVQSTFALFAERVVFSGMSTEDVVASVGVLLTLAGVVIVTAQLFLIRPIVERVGEQWLIVFGLCSLYFGLLGIGLSRSGLSAGIFLCFVALGQGFIQPSLQSLITRFGNEKTQGQLLGLLQSFNSLGLILGPIWAGGVFEFVTPQATYYVGAALMLPAIMLATLLLGRAIPTRRRLA